MSRQDVYDAYMMDGDPGAEAQFLGFTTQAMRQMGGAAIRDEVVYLGYEDPGRIVIDDRALSADYRVFAKERSDAIDRGYNDHLAAFVQTLPEDVTVADVTSDNLLAPFQADVREHNHTTLMPYIKNTAQQMALNAFYDTNISPQTGLSLTDSMDWLWDQNSDCVDDCTMAQEASPAPRAELEQIAGGPAPAHPNCDCDEYPDTDSLDAADVPAQSALWLG